VFIDDQEFKRLWAQSQRYYLFAELPGVQRLAHILNRNDLYVVATSGGKFLLTNHSLTSTAALPANIQSTTKSAG
jgi:hypothetical protein